jgi:hypothetical protein
LNVVIVVIFFAVAFVIVFFFLGLFSKEDIGGYGAIKGVWV